MPKAAGPGPTILGSVNLAGENLVAGCTIVTAAAAAISAAMPSGTIMIRDTYIRTSRRAMGISLSGTDLPVTIRGGGLDASAEGDGISIYGGRGDVTFEGFNVAGSFGSAIDIRGRTGGNVVFRGRAAIKIAGATQPAVSVSNCSGGRVEFAVPLQITARARGLFVSKAAAKIAGGSSWIATTDGTALEVRDASVDAAFVSISASGVLNEGIIIDKLRGTFVIAGDQEKPGSGGTIRNARLHGIAIMQSSNVRIANVTLVDDGSGDRAKCDEQVEAKTNLQCRAALYLRHVAHAELSNVSVTGGRQVGLNANNLQDVVFGGLEIRDVGDEASEAAVVLDEISGNVRFSRCLFEDAAGGAVVIAQQFNAGQLLFDRCTIGAAKRPLAAPSLVTLRGRGGARLEVELRNADIHDNAGSAVTAEAAGASVLRLTVSDSRVQRFGRTAIDVKARDQANASLVVRGSDVYAPGVLDAPAAAVAATDFAAACVDVTASRLVTGAAVPPVRLSGGPRAKLSMVRNSGGTAVDAPASAAAVEACQ